MASSTDTTPSVRPATAGDPASIGAIQARSWRMAYGNLLPERTLAALTPEALTPAWERAVRTPPTALHTVLVAVRDDEVVGFAAAGPSEDRDAGEHEGQLAVLVVDAGQQRAGHGSRLLSAVVDHLRDRGITSMTAWLPEGDLARSAFLTSAGMVPDGARRTYDGAEGTPVAEVRFTAELGPKPAPPTAPPPAAADSAPTGAPRLLDMLAPPAPPAE